MKPSAFGVEERDEAGEAGHCCGMEHRARFCSQLVARNGQVFSSGLDLRRFADGVVKIDDSAKILTKGPIPKGEVGLARRERGGKDRIRADRGFPLGAV